MLGEPIALVTQALRRLHEVQRRRDRIGSGVAADDRRLVQHGKLHGEALPIAAAILSTICRASTVLGARGSCQIGGNLATNAGGNGVVQFGMMREQTLGLEVVLADGTVLDMLRPMVKNNTGYDLKHFFIGAEGTLGVITRAQLRLQPAQPARATALAAVPDVASALELLGRLQARCPGGVAAFELMWQDFLQHALDWTGLPRPFDQDHPLLALTDLSGSEQPALAHALEEVLGQAMEDGLVLDAVLAQSQAQAAGLWQVRLEPVMGKQLHTGHAAWAGLSAATLAQAGFTGPRHILEGPHGFYAAMCADARTDRLLADDGDWLIHSASFKPWPACRHTHAAIDAARKEAQPSVVPATTMAVAGRPTRIAAPSYR